MSVQVSNVGNKASVATVATVAQGLLNRPVEFILVGSLLFLCLGLIAPSSRSLTIYSPFAR